MYEPGVSGNPGGRPGVAKFFRPAILSMLNEVDSKGVKAVHRITRRVVELAEAGDMRAVEFLADRIDGKVPQAIVGDDEHPPVSVETRDVAKVLGLIIEELKARQEAAVIEGAVVGETDGG